MVTDWSAASSNDGSATGTQVIPSRDIHTSAVDGLPDPPERGVPDGHPDPKPQIEALASPTIGDLAEALAHLERNAHSLGRVLDDGLRVVQEDHHSVAREVLECPAVGDNDGAHLAVILTQDVEDLLRLLKPFAWTKTGDEILSRARKRDSCAGL